MGRSHIWHAKYGWKWPWWVHTGHVTELCHHFTFKRFKLADQAMQCTFHFRFFFYVTLCTACRLFTPTSLLPQMHRPHWTLQPHCTQQGHANILVTHLRGKRPLRLCIKSFFFQQQRRCSPLFIQFLTSSHHWHLSVSAFIIIKPAPFLDVTCSLHPATLLSLPESWSKPSSTSLLIWWVSLLSSSPFHVLTLLSLTWPAPFTLPPLLSLHAARTPPRSACIT